MESPPNRSKMDANQKWLPYLFLFFIKNQLLAMLKTREDTITGILSLIERVIFI